MKPWALRLVIVAIALGSGAWASVLLQSLSDESKILDTPSLPRFLLLHAVAFFSWVALLWLGLPNPSGNRSLTRLNLFLKLLVVPSVLLASIVYAKFWQAIF